MTLYRRYRRLSLGMKILLFMVLGIVAGIVAGERATVVRPLGDLFIRLLMMGVIPLVFFNLLAGITSLPDLKTLGRVGGKIVSYYLLTTTLALFVSGFTTRRAYASVFLVGLFAITTPFTAGLAQEIEGPVGQWISMFNLSNIPVHVNDLIFGEVSDVTGAAPAGQLAPWILVSWFFLWTIGPASILWARYRRLTP